MAPETGKMGAGPFGQRVLPELLETAAREHGARTAIDFYGRTWRYAEVAALAARAARGLQDAGLERGERIGLALPNTPHYIILYFAILQAGGVVVNFNPLYSPAEMISQARDAGVRMMAVPDVGAIHDKVVGIAAEAAIERIIVCPMAAVFPRAMGLGWRWLKRRDHPKADAGPRRLAWHTLIARAAPPEPVAISFDDIAVLQYTGGTTGVPKGAMLSHGNLVANAEQTVAHIGDTGPGPVRTFGVLPLFHVFALTSVLNYSIAVAGEIVLLPRFQMKEVLRALARKPVTAFFGVPTMYIAFNALPDAQQPKLASLLACVSGGAPLPRDVRETFERKTGGRVVEGYGLTEASPVIACNPPRGEIRADSCGYAFPGTVIEIRDPDDPHTILGPGVRGEICARGPQVMKGYWRQPEASAAVFVDGALRTGDLGHLDADGYLFITDRLKDLIICSGYNVYPRVIEEAAYAHPAVKEAVAIGVPDAYRGEAPKLFVALREGAVATPDELGAFLAERLNKIELPREIELRESLPKTMIGKLEKKQLVAEEAARRAAATPA